MCKRCNFVTAATGVGMSRTLQVTQQINSISLLAQKNLKTENISNGWATRKRGENEDEKDNNKWDYD